MKVRELIQWLATVEDQDAEVEVVQKITSSNNRQICVMAEAPE